MHGVNKLTENGYAVRPEKMDLESRFFATAAIYIYMYIYQQKATPLPSGAGIGVDAWSCLRNLGGAV